MASPAPQHVVALPFAHLPPSTAAAAAAPSSGTTQGSGMVVWWDNLTIGEKLLVAGGVGLVIWIAVRATRPRRRRRR